jgi:hypothetical protein
LRKEEEIEEEEASTDYKTTGLRDYRDKNREG